MFTTKTIVIPAQAGIQPFTRGSVEKKTHIAADAAQGLDSGLRRNDGSAYILSLPSIEDGL